MGSSNQCIRFLLLILRHHLQLLSSRVTRDDQHGELGADCVGRGDRSSVGGICAAREKTFHASSCICRGQEDGGHGAASNPLRLGRKILRHSEE